MIGHEYHSGSRLQRWFSITRKVHHPPDLRSTREATRIELPDASPRAALSLSQRNLNRFPQELKIRRPLITRPPVSSIALEATGDRTSRHARESLYRVIESPLLGACCRSEGLGSGCQRWPTIPSVLTRLDTGGPVQPGVGHSRRNPRGSTRLQSHPLVTPLGVQRYGLPVPCASSRRAGIGRPSRRGRKRLFRVVAGDGTGVNPVCAGVGFWGGWTGSSPRRSHASPPARLPPLRHFISCWRIPAFQDTGPAGVRCSTGEHRSSVDILPSQARPPATSIPCRRSTLERTLASPC